VLLWTAFGLGMFLSIVPGGSTPGALIAGIAAAAYAVTMQIVPRPIRHSDNVGEMLSVSGVVVALLAVALTDGIDSPYLLFLATPSFFAGAFLGYRIGIATALLTSAGLIGIVAMLDQEILQAPVIQIVLLYILIATMFAQARRVLLEERAAAAELNLLKVGRLEAAHSALVSLQDLADAADLNPVSVGRAALRDLALLVPYEAGRVVLNDDYGPVVVARRGTPGEDGSQSVFTMAVGLTRLGDVELWPRNGESLAEHRGLIEELLRPVTLAYDNIALLRSVAGRAVQEERLRLARDLHDDLGPSLASLGLGMDMAILQEETGENLARHLETMRRSVTDMVETIRLTAADLRHDPGRSLTERANRIAAEIGADGPAVIIDLDERRPPRPVIADDLTAILKEAVRNAAVHAAARAVRIEGYVDRERGEFSVTDDGRGFEPDRRRRGHFGLIGMRERAEEIGARINIESAPGAGTRVTVKWGPP
jgi:signal transduction histidine kinase